MTSADQNRCMECAQAVVEVDNNIDTKLMEEIGANSCSILRRAENVLFAKTAKKLSFCPSVEISAQH
jgi:hypothetical protein